MSLAVPNLVPVQLAAGITPADAGVDGVVWRIRGHTD